mgnify:CR=1 FL=1
MRIHLCNPNMMALEKTSVTFSHFSVPGIFISQSSLQVTIGDSNGEPQLPSALGERAVSEEDYRQPDSDDESWTDGHSTSTFHGSEATPASPLSGDAACAEDTLNDLSDAFTPVTPRHRRQGTASKLGVRLAVVSSSDFEKIHKHAITSDKQRPSKYHRAAISLKAAAVPNTAGTATYKEVDYQNMKKLNPRPCHKHYLAVTGCPNKDRCNFGHHYQLTQSELLAVRVLAREMCCPYHLAGKCPHDVRRRVTPIPPSSNH